MPINIWNTGGTCALSDFVLFVQQRCFAVDRCRWIVATQAGLAQPNWYYQSVEVVITHYLMLNKNPIAKEPNIVR